MFTQCVKVKLNKGITIVQEKLRRLANSNYEPKLIKLRLHDCQLGCLDQRLHDTELLLDVLKQQAKPKQLNNTSTSRPKPHKVVLYTYIYPPGYIHL